jgi:two-component system response regulator HydG
MLVSFSWPGNIRQLRTALENMVVLTQGKILGPESLPSEIQPSTGTEQIAGMNNLVGISIEAAEKELIRNTLKMVDGNREQAAKILRIGERTLYRKIREYGL